MFPLKMVIFHSFLYVYQRLCSLGRSITIFLCFHQVSQIFSTFVESGHVPWMPCFFFQVPKETWGAGSWAQNEMSCNIIYNYTHVYVEIYIYVCMYVCVICIFHYISIIFYKSIIIQNNRDMSTALKDI
jgi:hypothetical protein